MLVRHKYLALLAIALIAIIALLVPALAFADETHVRAALDAAFRRAAAEADASPRLSFVETVAEKGVKVAARFDPAATPAWTPLSQPKTAQERKSLADIYRDTPDERDLLLHRMKDSITGPGVLLSDHDGLATFEFPMAPTARPTGTLLDQIGDLQSHIRVQLVVDQRAGAFSSMRFFAPQPFHATPIARVDRISLSFTFGPSYDSGPIVVRRVDTDIAYSIAGSDRAVKDVVWFSEIAPRRGRALKPGS